MNTVATSREQLVALDSVFTEAVSLFHRMRAGVEQLHGQGILSAARRGVLTELNREGPLTVPQMARARPVSRQHIQMLVNGLLSDGLVAYIENPAHKRSKLVSLTDAGRDFVETMARRENEALAELGIDIDAHELRSTADVLRRVRELFEGERWNEIVEAQR